MPKEGSGVYGGWCPNALIEARGTDFGEGACFYEEPARLVLPQESFGKAGSFIALVSEDGKYGYWDLLANKLVATLPD